MIYVFIIVFFRVLCYNIRIAMVLVFLQKQEVGYEGTGKDECN